MFDIVIGLVLAGVVFGSIKTLSSDTNTPAATVPIIALLGILFILGLAYDAAVQFGMVKGHNAS